MKVLVMTIEMEMPESETFGGQMLRLAIRLKQLSSEHLKAAPREPFKDLTVKAVETVDR